jgi:hypothetical protein
MFQNKDMYSKLGSYLASLALQISMYNTRYFDSLSSRLSSGCMRLLVPPRNHPSYLTLSIMID